MLVNLTCFVGRTKLLLKQLVLEEREMVRQQKVAEKRAKDREKRLKSVFKTRCRRVIVN